MFITVQQQCERQEGGHDTRCHGPFLQRITLPSPVDADNVEAKLANGVLSVTFPKSEEARPHQIALEAG